MRRTRPQHRLVHRSCPAARRPRLTGPAGLAAALALVLAAPATATAQTTDQQDESVIIGNYTTDDVPLYRDRPDALGPCYFGIACRSFDPARPPDDTSDSYAAPVSLGPKNSAVAVYCRYGAFAKVRADRGAEWAPSQFIDTPKPIPACGVTDLIGT